MKLKLKTPPPFRIDMSPITPQLCAGKSVDEVATCFLQTSGQKVQVQELFEISAAKEDRLEIVGACEKLDYIGYRMDTGTLSVSGNIGNYAGGKLSGGVLEIRGNVGDFCGHAMHGGRLIVRGNARDYCGGAISGHIHGLAGGEIFVIGDVGNYCGDHIRRGLIAIRGDVGNYCGQRMKAGTIITSGQCGTVCGNGMVRGSIILSHLPADGIAPTFISQGMHFVSDFLTILSNHLQKTDVGFEPLPLPKSAHRYVGDRALQGKGEILILES